MTIPETLNAVCGIFNVSPDELRSPSRRRELTDARKAYAWVLLGHSRLTARSVARTMCRTHGAAMACRDSANDLLATDKHFRRSVQNLCDILGIRTDLSPKIPVQNPT